MGSWAFVYRLWALTTGLYNRFIRRQTCKTPDAGAFWRVIEEYGVNVLFTAPTAIRAIRKEDPDGLLLSRYRLDSLRTLYLAGERCDPPTWQWAHDQLELPVVDHWWQTESGWPMVANPMGLTPLPVKPGSASVPVPGYRIEILHEDGHPLIPCQEGLVAIALPLPPGCLPTLWNDDARFVQSYLSAYPGYYLTGDGGYVDEENYVYIMGRVDDVINVAGHRLSTGEMEELVGAHPAVAECAVIGIADELRGQLPVGLVVLKDGHEAAATLVEAELVQLIREKIGAVAVFKTVLVVKRLPKTRSGKILRKTMRMIAMVYTMPCPPPSTILLCSQRYTMYFVTDIPDKPFCLNTSPDAGTSPNCHPNCRISTAVSSLSAIRERTVTGLGRQGTGAVSPSWRNPLQTSRSSQRHI